MFLNLRYLSLYIGDLRLILIISSTVFLMIYTLSINSSIKRFINIDRLFFDSNYASRTFLDYDDVFVSLENQNITLLDYDDNNNVFVESYDHDELNHNHSDAFEIGDFYYNGDDIVFNIEEAVEELELNSTEKTRRTDNVWGTNLSQERPNAFRLPIADALASNQSKSIQKRQQALKKDIANIYRERKELTLNIRELRFNTGKDIKKLKSIFKSLGMPISQKFLSLKADISGSKALKKLNLSVQELQVRYPDVKNSLEEIYRLRIFASFLPIHRPVKKSRRSSRFGYRTDPFTKKRRMHAGLDFAARTGTPLYATGVGVVKFAGRRGGYGNTIEIYHGNNTFTRYAHLSKINVKKGQRILKGQQIGAVGSTGRSTGPHLHYEIRINKKPINPEKYLNKNREVYKVLNKY